MVGGWIDGWVAGWMDNGGVSGWVDGCIRQSRPLGTTDHLADPVGAPQPPSLLPLLFFSLEGAPPEQQRHLSPATRHILPGPQGATRDPKM